MKEEGEEEGEDFKEESVSISLESYDKARLRRRSNV